MFASEAFLLRSSKMDACSAFHTTGILSAEKLFYLFCYTFLTFFFKLRCCNQLCIVYEQVLISVKAVTLLDCFVTILFSVFCYIFCLQSFGFQLSHLFLEASQQRSQCHGAFSSEQSSDEIPLLSCPVFVTTWLFFKF